MSGAPLILAASAAYLALLFAIAYRVDQRGGPRRGGSLVYALSLAVYCTSWTFYGSVGRAAGSGLDFLPIYLGPTLTFCLGWVLLRRILRISKANRITSIADFIASRYGKSAGLAALVAAIAVVGTVPYIALQLKAVSTSFDVFRGAAPASAAALPLADTAFWAAVLLALFAIVFGARRIDASERHPGMVAAIAFESVVKLVGLTAVGLFVAFALFDGPGDLFARAAADPELARLLAVEGGASGFDWIVMTLLAMAAIVCLPRQFQVMVTENADERHLDRAIWLFPLYLLAINLFVLPIALAGLLTVTPPGSPDLFVLTVPIAAGADGLALLAFLGGLSAAAGMIVVETVALSIMAGNDLVLPLLLRLRRLDLARHPDPSRPLLAIRRATIVLLLLLGYAYMDVVGDRYALVAIGLVSFAAVAQFAPAILFGLFWQGATRGGALAGIAGGFAVWVYTLLLPSFALSGWLPAGLVAAGPFGVAWLNPHALFGLDGLDPVTHSLFWSMLVNIGLLVGLSLATEPSALERAQAAVFALAGGDAVGRERDLWRASARLPDLKALVARFLGPERAEAEFAAYGAAGGGRGGDPERAGAGLVRHAERLLAGAIGTASARVVVGSVAKEEPIGPDEVMKILDETSQVLDYSRRLAEKSRQLEAATAELRAANERLRELDRLKDDFMSTVSHELRTPLTSIRSFSEILYDNPDLDADQRQEFLGIVIKESERLTRLINQMLDLAKIEAGRMEWHIAEVDPLALVRDAAAASSQLFRDRGVALELDLPPEAPPIRTDYDRMMQVVINLLSNAAKFSPRDGGGRVVLAARLGAGDELVLSVSDNGPGIAPGDQAAIFERFRQVGDDLTGKPEGTGLGLPICRMILDHLGGSIDVTSRPGQGATFTVRLPLAAAPLAAAG